MPDRLTNILSLKKDYKELLELYNMYDTNKPTPSIESIQLSNKHSFAIDTKRENQCPPRKPDFNPFTKKCTVKCKDGKVRNEKFRCVNNKTRKSKSSSKENRKETEELNKKMDKCKKENKDLNPLTNRCVKKCKTTQKRVIRRNKYTCITKKNE